MIFENAITNAEIYFKDISLISYLIVFFGGILTSFTPCIYPLVPVTIGYIGASSAGRRSSFTLSFFYVLGIAVIYSVFGVIAALTGSLFGEISTSPWTYLVVGNIFLLLGLSMMELFILPLPAFLKNRGSMTNRKGILGAFLVGVSAGAVISPCTAPLLGATLAYVASKQNLFFGATLLFTFAFGMGLLLILVGMFAGLAASLPKSGRWLNIVKKAFGIILIICAEYFILLAGKRFI